MKLLGFLLLLSGWGIVFASGGAIVFASIGLLAPGAARIAFVFAGMGVEIMGLALVIRSHPFLRGVRE